MGYPPEILLEAVANGLLMGAVYGLVALGLIDVVAESDLKIWDWAALVPVIEGAGGRVTDWAGQKLHPGSDGRVIALGDARLLQEAVHLLQS